MEKVNKNTESSSKIFSAELADFTGWWKRKDYSRFILTVFWSIPWVGWFLSAIAARDAEKEQWRVNKLYEWWIQECEDKIWLLHTTIYQILSRLNEFDGIEDRVNSKEYLELVNKWFKSWDNAGTFEKKEMIRKLLTNAWIDSECPYDLIRLFNDWINLYHEEHFAVIKEIYANQGVTRKKIWENIWWKLVREDSAEADLYRLLIRDLSTWSIIRQHKPVNFNWEFIKQKRKSGISTSWTLVSAFEDTKQYELTDLGKKFVHYVMDEAVTKIESNK